MNLSSDSKTVFLNLVRLGLGNDGVLHVICYSPQTNIDWEEIQSLALEQGLSAIVLDGIEKLPEEKRPPRIMLLEWIGDTQVSYEYQYKQYRNAIAELAGWHNAHGLKMMVLKGYACSLNWPKPEHRPCGDIDIWQFGQYKEADAALTKEKGIEIDNSHHHHTVYEWLGFTVENHYDFVNVHARRSSAEMEKVFKELGNYNVESGEFRAESQLKGCSIEGCKIPCVEVNGEKVYLPSPNLHALFLIRHMVSHFAAANITLRQVLDWAFLVEKHTKEIDWQWLLQILDKFHMREFFSYINAICVEDLGFEASIFPKWQINPQQKDRVLKDILEPAFRAEALEDFLPRVIYKYKRWKGNAWKHDMCYSEGRWSAFWSGIWAKILKPASI